MAGKWDEVSTGTLLRQLFRSHDLPAFFRQNQRAMEVPAMTEYLKQLCKARGLGWRRPPPWATRPLRSSSHKNFQKQRKSEQPASLFRCFILVYCG